MNRRRRASPARSGAPVPPPPAGARLHERTLTVAPDLSVEHLWVHHVRDRLPPHRGDGVQGRQFRHTPPGLHGGAAQMGQQRDIGEVCQAGR